jgi:hypothetical protein
MSPVLSSLVVLLAITGAGLAQAQGLQGSYKLQGGVSTVTGSSPPFSTFDVTLASPVTRAASVSLGSGSNHGSGTAGFLASADAGLLELLAQATSTSGTGSSGSPVNGAFMFTGGGAFATFTDFIISGPAGASTVTTSVNGALVVSESLTHNTNVSLALRGITASISVPAGTAFSVVETHSSEVFISPEFTLPVGQPFTLGMSLKTGNSQSMIAGTFPAAGGSAQAGLFESLSQSASLSLGSLARAADGSMLSGGVFNLPAGYTLNSVQANIVDNQWLGPTLPVPEPAPGLLWTAGPLVLAWHRRAKQF